MSSVTTIYTHPDDLESERAGAALGHALLQELVALRGMPQAHAFQAVRSKLQTLAAMTNRDAAAGGFAVALVPVLELGVANLPKVEGCK